MRLWDPVTRHCPAGHRLFHQQNMAFNPTIHLFRTCTFRNSWDKQNLYLSFAIVNINTWCYRKPKRYRYSTMQNLTSYTIQSFCWMQQQKKCAGCSMQQHLPDRTTVLFFSTKGNKMQQLLYFCCILHWAGWGLNNFEQDILHLRGLCEF